MQRVSGPPPEEAQPFKSPDPDTPGNLTTHKSSSFLLRLCLLHRLLLPLFLLSLLSLLLRRYISLPPIPAVQYSCPNGHIYVYDLPSSFNYDIISNCRDLNPWLNICPAVSSNAGFGVHVNMTGVVPASLLPFWFSTYEYGGEIIFHNRLLSHRCRTLDPTSASAFYVPFYVGFSIGRHLWNTTLSAAARDRHSAELLSWLNRQPGYINSGGSNHFLMIGRVTWDFRASPVDGIWGNSFIKMPGMQNVSHFVIERDPRDDNDVGVPHLTGFHPQTKYQLDQWQRFVSSRPRLTLFSFAGAPRANITDDFRKVLLDECFRAGDACKSIDWWRNKGNSCRAVTSLFLDSKFCLQPRGDSLTRRSMFDCMIAGAIPVIFWKGSAYDQYEWYLPGADKGKEWSVFLDRKEVRRGEVRIKEFLEGIGEERIKRMREKVVSLMPSLIYGGTEDGIKGGVRDAIDVAVDGVLKRFRERTRRTGSSGQLCQNSSELQE